MASAPVGQAVFPESGVPPVVTGCGVGPVCAAVMSVQTILVTAATEKKPVPSPFTTYLPVQPKMTSHVLPRIVSVLAIVSPERFPDPSAENTPRAEQPAGGN